MTRKGVSFFRTNFLALGRAIASSAVQTGLATRRYAMAFTTSSVDRTALAIYPKLTSAAL